MKKLFVTLLFATIGIAVSAQGDYKGFVLNANIGMTSYDANSAVSLFSSGDRLSTVSGCSIAGGYRNGSMMYGLRVGFNIMTVVHGPVDELSNPWDFSLMFRRYLPLNERFELYSGISVGYAMVANSYEYQGEQYAYIRSGITEVFEAGIDYRLSGASAIGLRAAISPFGALLKDGIKLPDGLAKNVSSSLGSYSLSMQYSLSF